MLTVYQPEQLYNPTNVSGSSRTDGGLGIPLTAGRGAVGITELSFGALVTILAGAGLGRVPSRLAKLRFGICISVAVRTSGADGAFGG